MRRPGWLAQRHLLRPDRAIADHAEPEDVHPEQEHEGQSDLREHGHQNGLDRHNASAWLTGGSPPPAVFYSRHGLVGPNGPRFPRQLWTEVQLTRDGSPL